MTFQEGGLCIIIISPRGPLVMHASHSNICRGLRRECRISRGPDERLETVTEPPVPVVTGEFVGSVATQRLVTVTRGDRRPPSLPVSFLHHVLRC